MTELLPLLARNYAPLPFTPVRADGGYLYDSNGRIYVDAISGYGVTNAGHNHRVIMDAITAQIGTGVLATSRAVGIAGLEDWALEICQLTGFKVVLPMTTGAEGVETAIKVMRKHAYTRRDIPDGQGVIVFCHGNFHGRTTTIVGMSTDPQYRGNFGPFAPGFIGVPFGNLARLYEVFMDNRDRIVMFLCEPVQAEGGMIVPPDGYWPAVRELCTKFAVPLVLDEIQTGFGRTGANFAYELFGIQPDGLVLGKYLGGGLPLSAFLTSRGVMDVIQPGDHGSTFGGNPLAIAASRAALHVLTSDRLAEEASTNGERLRRVLQPVIDGGTTYMCGLRGLGLMLGIELTEDAPPASQLCQRLLVKGVVTNTAHDVIRLTPRCNLDMREFDLLVAGLTAGLARD